MKNKCQQQSLQVYIGSAIGGGVTGVLAPFFSPVLASANGAAIDLYLGLIDLGLKEKTMPYY